MAREAAHQMGTPLTSLQGWIEQLRTAGLPPEKVAEFLDADADRLQRVAQRFERIGNPARRDPVALGALAERVAGYFQPRLPKPRQPDRARGARAERRARRLRRSGAARVGARGAW